MIYIYINRSDVVKKYLQEKKYEKFLEAFFILNWCQYIYIVLFWSKKINVEIQ